VTKEVSLEDSTSNVDAEPNSNQSSETNLRNWKQLLQREDVNIYSSVETDHKLQNASVQIGLQRDTASSRLNANLTSSLLRHKN
jgi:hypothetical protein